MKKILFFLVVSMVPLSSFAILPPFWQSVSEIKTILDDSRLSEKLGSGELIISIERIDQGYLITTNKYFLFVGITYIHEPGGKIGPAKFTFTFNDPEPRN